MEDIVVFREIIKIKGESCSVGNFAVRLVQKFYSASELVNRQIQLRITSVKMITDIMTLKKVS